MQYLPFISVILPTKNNERTIRTCLESIFKQTYTNFEVIFVDNFSDDATFDIAKEYEVKGFAIHTYQVGPERNVQRHAGYEHASGDILYFIDSDMYINPILLEEISSIFEDSNTGAIIIPEENMTGEGYWTKVKAFERSLYAGDDQIEAARVFRRTSYEMVGGYNQTLISGEDWDLSERIRATGITIARTGSGVIHDEGEIELPKLLKKKFYYGAKFTAYTKSRGNANAISKIYFLRPSFYRSWKRYIAHPILFPGFLFLITAELLFGGVGFLLAKFQNN